MLKYLVDGFRTQPVSGTLIAITVCLIASQLWNYWRRMGKYPPGPIGLPIVGYLPFMLGQEFFHKSLYNLSKKYGDVFSLKLGQINTVVINDYEALKEFGRKDEFSNRPPGFFKWSDTNTHMGVKDGKPWKEQRRFMLSTLRNIGMGKLKVEEAIMEQIDNTVERFQVRPTDQDVNMREILSPSINNIIMSLICGKTYDFNDEKNQLMNDYQMKLFEYFEILRVPSYFPLIHSLYTKFNGNLRKIRQDLMHFENYLSEEIEQRQKHPDEDRKKDYIDYFLQEIKEHGNDPETSFSIPCLLGQGQLLLIAGSETTRSTLEWTLLCLARNQLFQEMVHKEIIEVLGSDGQVEWKDRDRLVLVQALILEVHRWKTLAALSDPHWTSEDVELSCYLIPKNTLILMNLWGVHNDVKYWGDPENFRPERFLSKDFKSIINFERVISFGIGKRSCPGEKLADIEIFLFITTLLQKLRFLPPENGVCMDEFTVLTQMVVKPIIRVEGR